MLLRIGHLGVRNSYFQIFIFTIWCNFVFFCVQISYPMNFRMLTVCFFCHCRRCIRKTQVEATRGGEITECREGVNGQMPSDLGREKGVALPGTPVEWFTVKQNKEDASDGPKSSSKMIRTWELSGVEGVWGGILWLFYTLHHSILGGILSYSNVTD